VPDVPLPTDLITVLRFNHQCPCGFVIALGIFRFILVHFLNDLFHGQHLECTEPLIEQSTGEHKQINQVICGGPLTSGFDTQNPYHLLFVDEAESSTVEVKIHYDLIDLRAI